MAKKSFSLNIDRERKFAPKVIVATGFKVRIDKTTGFLDYYLDSPVNRGERVLVDSSLLKSNLEMVTRYVSGLEVNPDDKSQKEDVVVGEQANISNIMHFSHMGDRAETIFGLYAISDWATAVRSGDSSSIIKSNDVVIVLSTTAMQKKMVLET